MDHEAYEKYRRQYLKKAYQESDHTPQAIYRALTEIRQPGRFAFNRDEKMRALRDLESAFEDRRHWPLDIILSHIDISLEDLTS